MAHGVLDDDLLVVPRRWLGLRLHGFAVEQPLPVGARVLQVLQVDLHHLWRLALHGLLGVLAILLGGRDPHALGKIDHSPLALGVGQRVVKRASALADERIHRLLAYQRVVRIEFALDGGIAPVHRMRHEVDAEVAVAHLFAGGELAPHPHLVISRRVERVHRHPPLYESLKNRALGPLVLCPGLYLVQDVIYGLAHRLSFSFLLFA